MACHRIQSLNLAEMSAMFYKPMLSSHVKGCNLYNVLLLFLHFIQLLNTSWKKKSNNKVLSSPFGMWQNHQLMFSSTSVSRPVKLPRRFFFGGLPWKKTKNKKKQTQPHTGCPKWNFLRWAWVLHITQILSFTWRTVMHSSKERPGDQSVPLAGHLWIAACVPANCHGVSSGN